MTQFVRAKTLAILQPTFNPIASNTTFGPLTDISMGWDGTLWGIDAQGAPHIHDAINDTWVQHGDGIDAAAQRGDLLYVFRGPNFVTASQQAQRQTSGPKTIAEQWPTLPDSFKLGVMGAANFNNKGLMLFNGGRFISTDGSIPLTALTSLTDWPQSPEWKDGVIDAVYGTDVGQSVILIRGNQCVGIDPAAKTVTQQPLPLSALPVFNQHLPPAWVASGFDAMTVAGANQAAFKGAGVVIFATGTPGIVPPTYIPSKFPGWPATWHPSLRHSPSGRDGALWCATVNIGNLPYGDIVMHDGDTWHLTPGGGNTASAGQDGTVMVTSDAGLFRWNGTNYDLLGNLRTDNLVQVSVANADTVWVRDSSNAVYQVDVAGRTFNPVPLLGSASHLAASNDGTLWHVKPNDPDMHRFLAEEGLLQPGIPVKQGLVSAVERVAATGFGAAHCLAQVNGQTQAYCYDSPYVFKTGGSFNAFPSGPIAQGLGMVFITAQDSTSTTVVALDAHIGTPLSQSSPLIAFQEPTHGQPVFDPVNRLVYVGTKNVQDDFDYTTPGQLLALDVRDLSRVVWSYTTTASIDAIPVVDGTTLVFGDRTGTLYAFDTAAAFAQATSNPPKTATPKWTWKVPTYGVNTHRVSPPLLQDGRLHAVVWDLPGFLPGGNEPLYLAWSVKCNIADGSSPETFQFYSIAQYSKISPDLLTTAPVPGTVRFGEPPEDLAGFFVNGGDSIKAIGPGATVSFTLPPGTQITTGLSYDSDTKTLWFCAGPVLYGLDKNLQPVPHTPFTFEGADPGRSILTKPVIYTDSTGAKTIFTGMDDSGAQSGSLYGFDPANGNIASVGTGATLITALSANVTHGVIYASGTLGNGPTGFAQVFGIRVDTVIQGLRDFIIESQLMQDPDPYATNGSTDPNNPIPPSVARYQTHLTLVDDQKIPLPNETVKIWADQPNTVISVDGVRYTIGPDDGDFAAVTSGIDGSLVLVSDAKNVNSSALRVWAPFMNPYERIVVYPDHEWHGRAAQSIADPSADPNRPDPTKANLSTAYTYTGAQLFTTAEKSENTPVNVANAISQMNKGLAPGGVTSAAFAGALKTLHASNPATRYVAYADLGGMHYAPSNARAKRPAAIAAPIGFRLSKPRNGPHTFTPLSHSAARSAIDALTGTPWDPNNPGGVAVLASPRMLVIPRSDNIFTDFWDWLVGAIKTVVQEIESVIVSVADDIMVGIQFTVDGVTKVFKAVIKVVEDVVNAIGAFFLQLAKLIEDVIQALSVLFSFGEIMWTHRWLAEQFNGRLADLTGAITSTIRPAVDAFFQEGETAIKRFFDSLRAEFSAGGNPRLNNTKGYGQTPHSVFNVGPRGGTPSSHATQCTWGTQKMKSGLPSAAVGSSFKLAMVRLQTPDAVSSDPVSDFFNAFAARLTSDPVLRGAVAQLKLDFGNLVKANSISQFFSQLMVTLLDIIETLVLGALAVANALIDGLLGVIQDAIAAVVKILNTEIEIPGLTWLYDTLFQEKLTFLNVATLVAAIPVTLLFRVIEGRYPSQAGLPQADALQGNQPQAAPKTVQMALGLFVGVFRFLQGIADGIGDATDDAPEAAAWAALGCGLLVETFTFPLIDNDAGDVSSADWAVYGIGFSTTVSGLMGVSYTGIDGKPTTPQSTPFMSYMTLSLSLVALAASIAAYVKDGKTDGVSNTEFAESIMESIVGMLNPIKLQGGEAPAVVVLADVVGGIFEMFLLIGVAIAANGSPRPFRRRL